MRKLSLAVLNMIFLGLLFISCNSNDDVTPPSNKSYNMVTTFAGSGLTNASEDGVGTQATFWRPEDLVADAGGNLYVVEAGASKIRKISPAGVVTTFAGNIIPGSIDGVGTKASFVGPSGLTIDASGNLYIADTGNNKIRKISPTGVVTTVAGTGVGGGVDGDRSQASFLAPTDVAVDASGNLYVADISNNKIRKINPSGTVSTFAGSGIEGSMDGVGVLASFHHPRNITIDDGNLYVSEWGSHKIRKISPAGVVTTLAGGGNFGVDGTGSSASFGLPSGITIDALGNLYVADIHSNKIRKITPNGVVTTFAGTGIAGSLDGLLATATFDRPFGVAIDNNGNIYIAGNGKIRKVAYE
ncbi:NHL repeat-containing protein [Flavobacterium sp. GT2N3]|uniref:NHL repeat-containing protein n=1 Tax=unclassified Flavobacterium TaxID=196869 RepID=UPI003AAA6913